MLSDPILVWHRRDLRLHDNSALHDAAQRSCTVIPVFILDPDILNRLDTAPARVWFMLQSLAELQDRYASIGARLIIQKGKPLEILSDLVRTTQASTVIWNQDVEPYAIQRDRDVTEGLQAIGIEVITHQDMLLHSPDQIYTQSGDPYSVFTPFWRNWQRRDPSPPYPTPRSLQTPPIDSLQLPTLAELGLSCDQDLPIAGEEAALNVLDYFCQSLIFDYEEQRNWPGIEGTSRLSPHLRWGTIGIRQVWQATKCIEDQIRSDEARSSVQTWRQELAWREFYKHVLAHWPRVETTSFRSEFDQLVWENRLDYFEAWCEGVTGYPIVDAAMRQLNQTGWMHNRCRMIVASFLTKDLLIDWRWGELYFMQKLVDGDLAANNGGWQWSASVGTDPKPLRIFNPSTQAARFDPEGEYIRCYLPEIAGLDTRALIEVGTSKSALQALAERHQCGYPDPLVDHKQRQQQFKQLYQACRSSIV